MLLSEVKFANTDYDMVLDNGGIIIYDGKTTKIIILEKAVLSGYRTEDGLWRIPLKKYVQNANTYTLLIQLPSTNEAIFHVFKLPSTDKTIAYYHATPVFPTKETWTDAIREANYDTWPGLTVKSVN